MKIRRAKLPDAGGIAKLYDELRKYELSLLGKEMRTIQLNWEGPKKTRQIKKWLRSKNVAVFVAEYDGKLAGFLTAGLSKGLKRFKEGSLDIYVKSGLRRKGIGARLMKEALGWFKSRGCGAVSLNVYSANRKAREFYEKFGFKSLSEMYKRKI